MIFGIISLYKLDKSAQLIILQLGKLRKPRNTNNKALKLKFKTFIKS